MKKILLGTLSVFALLIAGTNLTISNPTGAPAGRTGSPADGATCFDPSNGCHLGNPTVNNNIITSTVPTEGYTPGTSYTFTVTLTGTGTQAKGFQISPQKSDGTAQGTIIAGTGNKLTGANRYLTHSIQKTANPSTWTFTWIAPALGTGSVDFYGAFAVTRNTTYTQKLTIPEKGTGAVGDVSNISNFSLYPNPVKENLTVLFDLNENANVKIMLTDIAGKESVELFNQKLSTGNQTLNLLKPTYMSTGIYFLQMQVNEQKMVKKVFVE